MKQEYGQKKNGRLQPAVFALIVVSVLVNVLLSKFIGDTALPLYFDTVGTIAATALGGIIPGIITAFVTNVINSLRDNEAIYYASLNMLIAIMSSIYFGEYAAYKKSIIKQKKNYKKDYGQKTLIDIILFILVLAFIGGGLGGMITWFLYNPSTYNPDLVSNREWLSENPLAYKPMLKSLFTWISQHLKMGACGCHILSTYITDVVDKAVSVVFSVLIITFVPQKIKDYVKMTPWRQKPVSFEEQKRTQKRLKGRFSIGTRINIILILSSLLVAGVILLFSYINYSRNTTETLTAAASQAAMLAADAIDPEMIDEYIDRGNTAPGYNETKRKLSVIKNSSSDIAFLYVYKLYENECKVIIDLDAVLSDGSFVYGDAPGFTVPIEDALKPYLDEMLSKGKPVETEINDEYGRFYCTYYPVYNNGTCVCYAAANVEAKHISNLTGKFTGKLFLIVAGLLLLIVAISILTTKYRIVMPVMGMTIVADEMTDLKGGVNDESLEKLEDMDIHTEDEVEQLYRSLCKLTGDTVYQLNDNLNKNEAITKMQNVLIITMADMVESRDSDTGAHVLKTAAYVRIILQGLKRNGDYAEKINDKYMRDVEMSAPLHDVGKINISDTVLNKPGRLTKEEFEIMKTHTTAGKAILENAISSMEGDNYLKEARNMAAYHHERWDGTGYPEGLHGEVIPLSARVMAVADVFDALSSPRVYKKAFSFDEAVQMIKDGAGTQFDPKCVDAFMESLTEVKKIYKKYQET